MSFIGLIIFLAIFLVSGVIFALPAFIPALRQRARQSPVFRYMLISSLSIITYIVLFFALTYLGAIVAKVFYTMPLCGDFGCGIGSPYPFEDDTQRDALLTRELWLHQMLPLFIAPQESCLTGDTIVCDVAQDILRNTSTDYLIILLIMLIPAVSCAFTVRYLTRDNRKEKVKSAVRTKP